MLKIAMDVDGVLADAMEAWVRVYNVLHNASMTKKEITCWDFWRELGIDRREFYRIFYLAWRDWMRIRPLEADVSEAVELIGTLGQVDILTGRTRNTLAYVHAWLESMKIRYKHLLSVSPHGSKAAFNHDVFIDDSAENAREIASTGRPVLLYSQPWNLNVEDSPRIVRVGSLHDAYRWLMGAQA